MAKAGLDGHERGARVVAQGLRDAGMEVIYTGIRQTPEAVAQVAAQEDVAVVCVSSLSGAHTSFCRRLSKAMADNGIEGVAIILGGIVPEEEIPMLAEIGVRNVFGPGSALGEIAAAVREAAEEVHA